MYSNGVAGFSGQTIRVVKNYIGSFSSKIGEQIERNDILIELWLLES